MAARDAHPPDQARSAASLVGRICEACVRSVPVTGVAVSVMTSGGHRGVVSATDDVARSLEDLQFTVGQGPGCDAFATGHAVLVADLGTSSHDWTAYREAALELSVRAVFAFPLRLGAVSLGSLTAYRTERGALAGEDLVRAVQLSDAATVAVLDLIVGVASGGADGSASGDIADVAAEFHRPELYQAAGMVMEQLGVNIEVATIRLRGHAFAAGRPIGDVARDVVRRKLRLEADND